MLTFKAKMTISPERANLPDCEIVKIIELLNKEFKGFVAQPCDDMYFITQNRSLIYQSKGVYHGLLVLGNGSSDGMLVESQGYYYPNEITYMPNARSNIEREFKRDADYIMRNIPPQEATGEISVYIEEFEDCNGNKVRSDSMISRMFCDALKNHPAVMDVRFAGNCFVITPVQLQEQGINVGLKLRDVLLLGGMEDVYMVHETADVLVPGNYFSTIPSRGHNAYTAILDATVNEIRLSEHGPEIVLSGVSPELLMKFSKAVDKQEQAKYTMKLAM